MNRFFQKIDTLMDTDKPLDKPVPSLLIHRKDTVTIQQQYNYNATKINFLYTRVHTLVES